MPLFNQLFFQYPASESMYLIIRLHNQIMYFLILILTAVTWFYGTVVYRGNRQWIHPDKAFINTFQKNYLIFHGLVHGVILEIVWTIIPAFILFLIAFPSFKLLYNSDSVTDVGTQADLLAKYRMKWAVPQYYTVKVIGHQWYWSYQIPGEEEFDSYMLPLADMPIGAPRLLDVDNAFIYQYVPRYDSLLQQ